MAGIIWVVDSNDRERIFDVANEFDSCTRRLQEVMDRVPVLVFANKQEFPTCMSLPEIVDKSGISRYSMIHCSEWWIQPCCALSGDGLIEGLRWLGSVLL